MYIGQSASSKRNLLIFLVSFVFGAFVLCQRRSWSRTFTEPASHYEVTDLRFDVPQNSYLETPTSTVISSSTITETTTTWSISESTTHSTQSTFSSTSSAQTPISNSHEPWDEVQDKVYDYIQWSRPKTEHWPPWHAYEDKRYDPNRWEGMEREHGYFTQNTVNQLEQEGSELESFLPYPDYNSEAWRKKWRGLYVKCPGPKGAFDLEHPETMLRAYNASLENFPKASVGSAAVIGLDETVCFDRFSRYSPYGLINSNDKATNKPRRAPHPGYKSIGWGRMQNTCLELNLNRFEPASRVQMTLQPTKQERQQLPQQEASSRHSKDGNKFSSRTAVLIRTWEGYKYSENDLQAIRALITELSLMSGGEYQVYLLVNVKEREANIYNNQEVYNKILRRSVPAELRDIAVLWTERVLEEWYPKVGDWQVYWMQFMPLQWFSKTHPEFDYIWNWEMDARYIGNHYHFLEQIAAFARKMPRKHLWERNSRFYIPSHHGSWEQFLADTDEAIYNATREGVLEPVWGPQPYAPFQMTLGPEPPVAQEADNFEWGVDEEADLVTLQPIWDPSSTVWSYRNHIWNFIPTVRPEFVDNNRNGDGIWHPGFVTIPRRVFINTQARLSKRLLDAMHFENLEGRSMQAEMWPATVALQHGLKAVYAPHPIWTDRKWPGWYMDAVFNANNNVTARWSQEIDSPYNQDRENNFRGWSWYFHAVFPHVLYRRWLGWRAHDWGWDAETARTDEWNHVMRQGVWDSVGGDGSSSSIIIDQNKFLKQKRDSRIDVAGRMCLPGMLLHPVKNVREDADGG